MAHYRGDRSRDPYSNYDSGYRYGGPPHFPDEYRRPEFENRGSARYPGDYYDGPAWSPPREQHRGWSRGESDRYMADHRERGRSDTGMRRGPHDRDYPPYGEMFGRNDSPEYSSRYQDLHGVPPTRDRPHRDDKGREMQNTVLANDVFRDLLMATGKAPGSSRNTAGQETRNRPEKTRDQCYDYDNRGRSHSKRSSSKERWYNKRHRRDSPDRRSRDPSRYKNRPSRRSRSSSSSSNSISDRSRSRNRRSWSVSPGRRSGRRRKKLSSSGRDHDRRSSSVSSSDIIMSNCSSQLTEQEFKEEMCRRLQTELTSGKESKGLEERIAYHLQEMAKLCPAMFKKFMATNSDNLSAMILMPTKGAEEQKVPGLSDHMNADEQVFLQRIGREISSTSKSSQPSSKKHPLDMFEDLTSASQTPKELVVPSIFSSLEEKEKVYEQWRAAVFQKKSSSSSNQRSSANFASAIDSVLQTMGLRAGFSQQIKEDSNNSNTSEPGAKNILPPHLARGENISEPKESSVTAKDKDKDGSKRRATSQLSQLSPKRSRKALSEETDLTDSASSSVSKVPYSDIRKSELQLWRPDQEEKESVDHAEKSSEAFDLERIRQLIILQNELDALKKLENDILRKLRHQKDGHKDPIILENVRCQQEIKDKMEAIRQGKEWNPKPSPSNSSSRSDKHRPEASEVSKASRSSSDMTSAKEKKSKHLMEKEGLGTGGSYCCTKCHIVCGSLTEFGGHLSSQQHQNEISDRSPWQTEALKKYKTKGHDDQCPIQGEEFLMATAAFYCSLCSELCADIKVVEAHLKSEEHFINYNDYLLEHPSYEQLHKERCRALLQKTVSVNVRKQRDTAAVREESEGTKAVGRLSDNAGDCKAKLCKKEEPIAGQEETDRQALQVDTLEGELDSETKPSSSFECASSRPEPTQSKEKGALESGQSESVEKSEKSHSVPLASEDVEVIEFENKRESTAGKKRKSETQLFTRSIPKSSTQQRLLTVKSLAVSEASDIDAKAEKKDSVFVGNSLTEPNLRWLWKPSVSGQESVSSTSSSVMSETVIPQVSPSPHAESRVKVPMFNSPTSLSSQLVSHLPMLTTPSPQLVAPVSVLPSGFVPDSCVSGPFPPFVPAIPTVSSGSAYPHQWTSPSPDSVCVGAMTSAPPLPPPIPACPPPPPPLPPTVQESAELHESTGLSTKENVVTTLPVPDKISEESTDTIPTESSVVGSSCAAEGVKAADASLSGSIEPTNVFAEPTSVPEVCEPVTDCPETSEPSDIADAYEPVSDSLPETHEPSDIADVCEPVSDSLPETSEPSDIADVCEPVSDSLPETYEPSGFADVCEPVSDSLPETHEPSDIADVCEPVSDSLPETSEPSDIADVCEPVIASLPKTSEPSVPEVCELVDSSLPKTSEPACVPEVCQPVGAPHPDTFESSSVSEVSAPVNASLPETSEPACVPEVCEPISASLPVTFESLGVAEVPEPVIAACPDISEPASVAKVCEPVNASQSESSELLYFPHSKNTEFAINKVAALSETVESSTSAPVSETAESADQRISFSEVLPSLESNVQTSENAISPQGHEDMLADSVDDASSVEVQHSSVSISPSPTSRPCRTPRRGRTRKALAVPVEDVANSKTDNSTITASEQSTALPQRNVLGQRRTRSRARQMKNEEEAVTACDEESPVQKTTVPPQTNAAGDSMSQSSDNDINSATSQKDGKCEASEGGSVPPASKDSDIAENILNVTASPQRRRTKRMPKKKNMP